MSRQNEEVENLHKINGIVYWVVGETKYASDGDFVSYCQWEKSHEYDDGLPQAVLALLDNKSPDVGKEGIAENERG